MFAFIACDGNRFFRSLLSCCLNVHRAPVKESGQHAGGPEQTRGFQPGHDGAGSSSVHPQNPPVQPVSSSASLSLLQQGTDPDLSEEERHWFLSSLLMLLLRFM